MIALHYIILNAKLWLVLFSLFKVNKPRHFWKVNIGVVLPLIVVDIIRYLEYRNLPMFGIDVVVEVILTTVVAMFLLRNLKPCLTLINIIFINSLVSSIIGGFLSSLLQLNSNVRIENTIFSIFSGLISLIIVAFISLFVNKISIGLRIKDVKLLPNILIFISVFAYGFYVNNFLILGNQYSYTTRGQIINIVAALAGFASIFVVVGLVLKHAKVKIVEAEYRHRMEMQRIQEFHFDNIAQKDKETRGFRHDIINHLMTLKEQVMTDNEKAINYISNLTDEIDKIQNLPGITIGSRAADINLTYIASKFDEVKLNINGNLPVNFIMNDYDITQLFSNLFKNAFEAASSCVETKIVSIDIRQSAHYILIYVRNSFSSVEEKFKTTKMDKDNHGFGLEKIEEIVKKYKGEFTTAIEDDEFISEIIICQKPNFDTN